MKWIVCSVVVVLGAITPHSVVAEESNSPELVAALFPASGLIPVGNADHPVYRFAVSAEEIDDSGEVRTKGDAVVVKVSEDTLVEPGQTRTVSSPREREWRLEGTVTIQRDGFVKYHVTLLRKGERVASTTAGMRLQDHD